MTDQILATKLYIPPARTDVILRPRLATRLDQGLQPGYKLSLVSAPAGYGKTTLLSTWARDCKRRMAWLSLDEGDNDEARFLAYLIAALQKADPQIGEGPLSLIRTTRKIPMEAVLTGIINQISALHQEMVLVLDDYHLIAAQPVHEAIAFLLDSLPGNLHLIIATRADPPLSLARLRGRGQLNELRAVDLRFTLDETVEYIQRGARLQLSHEEMAGLASRTEGWIAGLQMAAISMRGKTDHAAFVDSFSGSHEYIMDYLTDEVLAHQPEPVKDFLLQTSILDSLSGPLCEAITGQVDSQKILERLQERNAFILPMDHERRWYRYHHLFADLLQQRLEQSQSGDISQLHIRASFWLEQNGMMAEAIGHALSAAEFERAAALIERAAERSLMHGEVKTFLGWIDALPDSVLREKSLLSVYHAQALLLSGSLLNDVAARLEGSSAQDSILALLASYKGDVNLSVELSRRALEQLPRDSYFLRGAVNSALGAIQFLSGDLDPAIDTFSEVAKIGRVSENRMREVIALSRLGQLNHINGELRKAKGYYQQALELSVDHQGSHLPIAAMPLAAWAFLLREWNQLEWALSCAREAVELSQQSGGFWSVDCYSVLAFILQAQGDFEGARGAISTAREIAARTTANWFDDLYVSAYEARLFAAQDDLEGAMHWVRKRGLDKVDISRPVSPKSARTIPLFHLHELEQMTLARIYLAKCKGDDVLAILLPLLSESERLGRRSSVIENLILQALAYQQKSKHTPALSKLETALSLAEPEGYLRIFIDEGQPMEKLLDMAKGRGIAPDYVARVLAAIGGGEPVSRPRTAQDRLVEPLSEREGQVLRLLVTELSVPEIAREFVIAPSTVRSHIKNIYQKLDVHSRYEAVVRAKELDLL